MKLKVALILGSDSDSAHAQKAAACLEKFGLEYEAHIYSAHRTPVEAAEFAKNAADNGFGVLIAFAGMAAHLAGSLAAQTILPVIGVPLSGGALDGLDALLSTVQMPGGVPLATVALNGSVNAALLAVQILALNDTALQTKLQDHKNEIAANVLKKDRELVWKN